MLVIPCSMGTLAAVANGTSDDLIARAADVVLKEGRTLALCIRDTPFNRVHLENMMRAQQAGAVIMPVIPAFYDQPKTIDDLVTQYTCRVLAQIGLAQDKMYRWAGRSSSKGSESVKSHTGHLGCSRFLFADEKKNRIRVVLEMIKFEHSVCALPFALTGALLAARASRHGWPTLRQVLWIVVAMVAARSAAMTINRIVDLRYDRENPRTNKRALATGELSRIVCMVVYDCGRRNVLPGGLAAQSSGIGTGPDRARHSFLLFLHQALHELVAPFSWFRAGNLSGSRMDRRHRRIGLAHRDSLRSGDAVGRRF